jgi:hypothetical protein
MKSDIYTPKKTEINPTNIPATHRFDKQVEKDLAIHLQRD